MNTNDLEKVIDVKLCYLVLIQQRSKYSHTVTPEACLKHWKTKRHFKK